MIIAADKARESLQSLGFFAPFACWTDWHGKGTLWHGAAAYFRHFCR